jgi:hypothetical protein
MNHQKINKNMKPTPEAYVNRYIRFDPPSRLPSLMSPWAHNVERSVEAAMRLGCAVMNVKNPVPGTEIIGTNARMLIRDHDKPPVKGIALQDQFCVFDLDSEYDAYRFMDCLLSKVEHLGHELEYVKGGSDKSKHFVVRTNDGYTLYAASSIGQRHDDGNKDAVELFVHWRIDYYAPRKRQSNHASTDRNLSDSAKTTR